MKCKKGLSLILAVCMTLGSAAVLPQSTFADTSSFTVSAETFGDFEYTKRTDSSGSDYITLNAYKGTAKDVVVPEKINGITIRYMDENVFKGNKTIENVKILARLSYIIQNAFKDCTSLKSVEFSDDITYTYHNVFENCTSLERVKLPDRLRGLNTDFFKGCTKLSDITFPSAIKSIPGSALDDTKWLLDRRKESPLVIVNHILVDAKTYAKPEITIQSDVRAISSYAFSKNNALVSVNIPNTVTSIGFCAFAECENLEKAVINANVNKIDGTFNRCTKLKDVTLCEGIEVLQNYTFGHCESLKSIKLPSTIKELGFEPFYYCTNLEQINLPDGLERLGYQAFYYCKKFEKLSLPSNMKSIDTAAFKYSGLKELYVPASVNSIKDDSLEVSNPSQFTLTCHKNSVAAQFAKDHNIKTVLLPEYNRYAGLNRYATAASISRAQFPNADTVVLANGTSFADALAGVPLAKAKNAPILLVTKDSVPVETKWEIARLGAKNIILLGGEGVISKNVEKSFTQIVTRISGPNRYCTAIEIAKQLNKQPDCVVFVYANDFADALSISPVAAVKGIPILYLGTDGELNKDTEKYLSGLKEYIKYAYVIGGKSVISDAMVEKAQKAAGFEAKDIFIRIAGSNRYETCHSVNIRFESLLNGSSVCVAKGLDFPDALAGGVLAAMNNSPLMLADKALKDSQKFYLEEKKKPDCINVFGGTSAVHETLADEIIMCCKE